MDFLLDAGPLMIVGLPQMKNVVKLLAKRILMTLGLIVAASEADEGIYIKLLGTITLIISKEEMEDIMKVVKSLEEFDLLIKGVSKTIEIEIKEQNSWFLSMLLGTLGATL